MQKSKNKKKIFVISAISVLLIGVAVFFFMTRNKTEYNSVQVKNKDIITYLNFSGNVQAENTNSVISPQSLKLEEIKVSEGAEVKKGDIIAILDTEELEKQLKTQESSVEVNNINLSYAYTQSTKNYNEAKEKYEKGLNPEINNAEKNVLSSKNTLDSAQKKYDDAQKKLDEQNSGAIVDAKSQLRPAEISYSGSKTEYYNALKKHYSPEETEKILLMEDKLASIQLEIDSAKADMRISQGSDNAKLEEAAKRLDEAQNEYDELSEDIYDEIRGSIAVTQARISMEQYKKHYDDVKDVLNETINNIDVDLSTLKVSLDNAQINYNKSLTMLEISKLNAEQQLKSLENAMERDRKVIENQPSLLELANLRARIDDCAIKSDYDGIVTSIYADEGTMVSMGQPIVDIIDNSKLEVQIKIDEYDAPSVKAGAEVTVYVNSLKKEISGKIKSISQSAFLQNGIAFFTADVVISDTTELKSGMSAEVKLLKQKSENTPCLPMTALRFDDDNKPFVYIKDNGKIKEKYITIGINDGNKVEITEGLSDGDMVYVPKSFGISMFEMMGM